MLFSAILPGLGQAYIGKWKRGLIYLAVEGLAVGYWYQQNIRAEDRQKEYEAYAAERWDFSYWIHDYYKWLPYDENDPDSEWNSIRLGFVNNSDDCAEPPHCYIDIWNNSHSVEFRWNVIRILHNHVVI